MRWQTYGTGAFTQISQSITRRRPHESLEQLSSIVCHDHNTCIGLSNETFQR
jgi:hypothetical protein